MQPGWENNSAQTQNKFRAMGLALVTLFLLSVSTCSLNSPYRASTYGGGGGGGGDSTPPAEVTALTATGQDAQVLLTWTDPPDADFSFVEISGAGFTTVNIGAGAQTATITGLTNGTLYSFLISTFDTNSNGSTGVSASATPTDRWVESPLNPLFGGTGVNRAYYPAVAKAGAVYHIWYGDGSTTRHATSTFADFRDVSFATPAPEITVGGTILSAKYTQPTYHPSAYYRSFRPVYCRRCARTDPGASFRRRRRLDGIYTRRCLHWLIRSLVSV
jgi:hypothetical protein